MKIGQDQDDVGFLLRGRWPGDQRRHHNERKQH
jgi:hypothetical protein